MKDRPILFSAPMVRALLNGRKTQTRRIVKYPRWAEPGGEMDIYEASDDLLAVAKISGCLAKVECPHGVPGDRLWVRETFYSWVCRTYTPQGTHESEQCVYAADGGTLMNGAKWRPSIFMPRDVSRITLEITEVRVQRLQEISEEDAKAEGCDPWSFGQEQTMTSGERGAASPYRGGYACLWDEINGDRASWKSNPWVWALTFSVRT